MRQCWTLYTLLPLCLAGGSAAFQSNDDDHDEEFGSAPTYTADFGLERCKKLVPKGNRYFPLHPGDVRHYMGIDDGKVIELEITVQDKTKTIEFMLNGELITAKTRVLKEREWENGELIEISKNFFAKCKDTDDVFYFGEDVDIYEDGEVVSHDGEWRAGQDGAIPGLIMPATFLLGSRYFQEQGPGAMDQARHVKMGLTFTVPAGTFTNCIKIRETTPLEPGSESVKIYAPVVGLIYDDGLELMSYTINP